MTPSATSYTLSENWQIASAQSRARFQVSCDEISIPFRPFAFPPDPEPMIVQTDQNRPTSEQRSLELVASSFRDYQSQMTVQIEAHAEENRKLRSLLLAAEARIRELIVLQEAEIASLDAAIIENQRTIRELQSLLAESKKSALSISSPQLAVHLAKKASDARLAAAEKEALATENAFWQQEIQRIQSLFQAEVDTMNASQHARCKQLENSLFDEHQKRRQSQLIFYNAKLDEVHAYYVAKFKEYNARTPNYWAQVRIQQ